MSPIPAGVDIETITITMKSGETRELRGEEARAWFSFAATAWKSAAVFGVKPPKFEWKPLEEEYGEGDDDEG